MFSLIQERSLSGWSDFFQSLYVLFSLTGEGDSTWLGWLSLVLTCAAYDDKGREGSVAGVVSFNPYMACCVFVFISLIIGEAMLLAFNISFVMLCQRLG